jgi:dTDP-6-deoxy-L-talose 4-dehydrogenase (NAD+)
MSQSLRVAVTGAGGFVGGHVVDALLAAGHTVVVATRAPERVARFAGRVDVVTCDLADPDPTLHDRLAGPDVLVHLAWEGLPHYRSRRHFEVEGPRHYRFVRALVEAGLRRVVVAGTCFEYGLADGCLREDRPTAPVTAYGFAKDALRQALALLRADVPFELVWARLFYLHGPGQAATSLPAKLHAAIAAGETRFAMSSGEQLRDYLPVEAAAGRLAALAAARGVDGIVNVCSGVPVAVRTLAERWVAATGRPLTLEFGRLPLPAYEPLAFWGDPARLHALVGPPTASGEFA